MNGSTSARVVALRVASLVAALALLLLAPGTLHAQTAAIGGEIFTGSRIPDPVDPSRLIPNTTSAAPLTGARVMVQNQHSGGAFVAYGTVAGNSWTADVPAPGDYVVMFSAAGHDATSREFTVDAAGNVTNPNGTGDTQDAFLPPLPLPAANLLVYAFRDDYVNGEDDFPDDPPLKGVTFTVKDEEGNVLATGVTGTQSPADLPAGAGPHPDGLYYFTGLPPGEVIVTSDPSTIPLHDPSVDPGTEWYLMTSEEGGPAWDPKLYPGDPGTEDGAYLIWHGYVRKIGQIGDPGNPTAYNPATAGRISGTLWDADRANLDPDEPFPVPGQDHPGVSLNDTVPDGFVVLFTNAETIPVGVVATTEADPVTGDFEFDNVPPGRYKLFLSDVPLDYVWSLHQLNVRPGQHIALGGIQTLLPRFFARAQGYVYDVSTDPPNPVPGATVHIRYKDGSIKLTETTDASGWYGFDDLPEIEVIGHVDVEPPPGYRGAIVTETFYPTGRGFSDPTNPDPVCGEDGVTCYDVSHNAVNRYLQWYTANYRADLLLEPIPAATGEVSGFVFNDHFARGTWIADGTYDPEEERTLHGVTVELWDSTGSSLLATRTTGKFDKAATLAQGWHQPYTWPPDEFGGVFVGPLPGFFEFRNVAPGDYLVKVIAPPGFAASPAGSDVRPVTVTGGARAAVDFGVNTMPPGSAIGVPLAGEIEGGVFDDLNIDVHPYSLLFAEKAGIPGAPIGVYDHLGYRLGSGRMGNPLCYEGAPDDPAHPGVSQCPAGEDPIQKPELERRFAPGVHLYVGNDPSLPGYNPLYLPLTLPYEFGQGKYKFEADWSLVPVAFGGLFGPLAAEAQLLPDNRPVVHAVTPLNPERTRFRLTGAHFGDRRGHSTVVLGGRRLSTRKWTDTEIIVKVHLRKAVSGSLLVATSTGISNGVHVEIDYPERRAEYLAERSVFVDARHFGPQDGSREHPWRTITDALDNLPSARPRYVFVAPGTYHERIRIDESRVYLIGAGPQETTINGIAPVNVHSQGFNNGAGPVIFIGEGGEEGGVKHVKISGFTITGGTVEDEIGAGIFGDYGNRKISIDNNIIARNGGYYGGGIWLHYSNHDVSIWSNVIAENGNYGGYGGGISVNDEPEYGDEHGEPEHVWDDHLPGPPPGHYRIHNNLIYHNYSPDYGGGMSLYEIKDHLKIYGNMFIENKSDDHGGAIFFEDTGPIDVYDNVFLRNYCADDGGAISFEDVGDDTALIWVYNNLFAENIADDRGENHARGGALAFDDTFYARVHNNTIVGNIVTGSYDPAGGGIDSERNGHEYNGESAPYKAPGFSDPMIYNNIIWDNWRLRYDQPGGVGEEDDLDYTWGVNYCWIPDNLHVDNPHVQEEWQSDDNSESFTHVEFNIVRGGYLSGAGNVDADPLFVDPGNFDWNLSAESPAINGAPANTSPTRDLQRLRRRYKDGWVDLGAYEFQRHPAGIVRIPAGILGAIELPTRADGGCP